MRSILDIRPFSTTNAKDVMGLMESFAIEMSGRGHVQMERLPKAFTLPIGKAHYHGYIGYIENYPMCLIAVEERRPSLIDVPYGQITELYVEPQFRWEGASALLVEKVEALSRTCGWSHINPFTPDEQNRPVQSPADEYKP